MAEDYLTAREAQAYLKIGHNLLLKLRREGLPCIKLEKRVLFRKSDIDRYMESRIKPFTPPAVKRKKRSARRA